MLTPSDALLPIPLTPSLLLVLLIFAETIALGNPGGSDSSADHKQVAAIHLADHKLR